MATGFPLQRVAMDILGPLPETSHHNHYIVVMIDTFTRWPEAAAIPNMEAAIVAHVFIDTFISRYGAPVQLHTDQGRQFESHLFQQVCHLLGIRKTRTTTYHPQSDGASER